MSQLFITGLMGWKLCWEKSALLYHSTPLYLSGHAHILEHWWWAIVSAVARQHGTPSSGTTSLSVFLSFSDSNTITEMTSPRAHIHTLRHTLSFHLVAAAHWQRISHKHKKTYCSFSCLLSLSPLPSSSLTLPLTHIITNNTVWCNHLTSTACLSHTRS